MNNFELFVEFWFKPKNLALLRERNEDLAVWVEHMKEMVEKKLAERLKEKKAET